jgi:hypothetical protein
MTTPPATLPSSPIPLLVRTAFGDDAAWASLLAGVATPSEEGFLGNVEVVDVRAHQDASPERLRALLPAGEYVTFFFVADRRAVTDADHPLLVVPVPRAESPFLDEPPREQFRVVVANLWAVENNLSLSNMDWEDFAGNTADGVFRGF